MRKKGAPADLAIARIAARQHGVVTAGQVLEAGLAPSSISRRVGSGRLHRLHQGVYAVGHRGVSPEGSWLGAVLACGDGAVLSHRAAAALWDLLPRPDGPIDVSTPARNGRRKRIGIRLHRSRSLSAVEVTQLKDIPVTTPARTIADLRTVVPPWRWRKAVRNAEVRGLALGAAKTDRTRSDLERDFLRLCRRHSIPAPEVNVEVGRWTVDFLWRRERVAVETDFYGYHRGRIAFQDDRQRDLDLRRLGFAVRRFSERQVNEHGAEVAADLREALGLAS
jgi:very-short-patch-repair endonuclease